MKLCDETITLFNAKLDPVTGYDVYTGTVIHGVSWHSETASAVDTSGGGLKAADKITVRIPNDAEFSGKVYVDPITYATCNPANCYTFQSGDIIVKGEIHPNNPKPADLQKQYAEVFTVLGLTNNQRTTHAPHWRVVGA